MIHMMLSPLVRSSFCRCEVWTVWSGVGTLKSVTEMSMFSGTGHTTMPLYGFLIPGCQLWSCTTNNHVSLSVSVCVCVCVCVCVFVFVIFKCFHLGAHASVPPGPHHPQLVWLPTVTYKHRSKHRNDVSQKCYEPYSQMCSNKVDIIQMSQQ